MATPELVQNVPDNAVSIVSQDGTTPRHLGGRPLKMTLSRFLRICEWIQSGKSNSEACRIENVSYFSFTQHRKAKRRWESRYQLANKIRDDYVRDFHLSNIVRHSENYYQASCWLLERRWPEQFSLRPELPHREPASTLGPNSTAQSIRILTVTDADFEELSRTPGYTGRPDGGLDAIEGNVRITIYRMEENDRLLN